jgi:polyketide synthase PksM
VIKDQLIFSTNNPITSNHKVYGQAILPGMAYIDLLFQCFKKQRCRFNELEIKNLTILNPLMVSNGEKLSVSVLVRENGPRSWKVEIEGLKLYATAEMLLTEAYISSDTLDVDGMKQRAEHTYPIADIYATYAARNMVHQGFIKAEGNIYALDNGLLFDASLGRDAIPTAGQFMFHPTLMDGSAVAMMRLFEPFVQEGEKLFLPIYYESFRAAALINKNCYAFLPVSSIIRKNDIIIFTIYFFDATGQKIGELKNCRSKKVREGLAGSSPVVQQIPSKNAAPKAQQEAAAILKQLMGNYLNIDPDSIDTNTDYYRLGFDSISLPQLGTILGKKIGEELSPTIFFEYATISILADYLTTTYPETFL